MKIHSKAVKITVFSIVFLFFILPPLFNTKAPSQVFSNWTFPLTQLILFLLSLILLFINDSLFFDLKSQKHSLSYRLIFPAVFTLCILFGISFLINGLSIIISHNTIQEGITPPSDFKGIFFCGLTFLFSAFFEESIYRFFLPESLKDFFKTEKNPSPKFIFVIIEVLTALLFAFSHRYAGLFSVINALFAHAALRICWKKTGSIYAGFTAHFIYNIAAFMLLSLN